MAKADRVNAVVTAAVIEALEKDKSGLVAEITADVLTKPSRGTDYYSSVFASYCGGGDTTYLERIARQHIRDLAAQAVKDWIDARQEDIRQAVVSKLDADALADSYVRRLLAVEWDDITVSVDISGPDSDDDD